jgi:hypothetical protein
VEQFFFERFGPMRRDFRAGDDARRVFTALLRHATSVVFADRSRTNDENFTSHDVTFEVKAQQDEPLDEQLEPRRTADAASRTDDSSVPLRGHVSKEGVGQ